MERSLLRHCGNEEVSEKEKKVPLIKMKGFYPHLRSHSREEPQLSETPVKKPTRRETFLFAVFLCNTVSIRQDKNKTSLIDPTLF